ncbi:MAG: baseplate hub protein [Sulfuriferula sp.]
MNALCQLPTRNIKAEITLGAGQFGDEEGDTISLTGLRIMAAINLYGGEAQGQAAIRIFGLPLAVMNKLTSVGPIMNQIRMKNTIRIYAGDEGAPMSLVYQGVIDTAYAELNSAPDVALAIVALGGYDAAMKTANPTSFPGAVDVAVMMEGFAKQLSLGFKNSGVSVKLSNHSCNGTLLDRINECAHAAGINYSIDRGVLRIWNQMSHTDDDTIHLSPQSGLVGYPALNSQYIALKSIFIPNAHLGQRVTVSGSDVENINGTWTIFTVTHNLESQTPNGQWFTELQVFTNGN